MCCFTRPVDYVNNTRIFARLGDGVNQFIAYAMSIGANEELAMVLPVPVVPNSGEKAMKFIDLSKYPRFFEDMESGFPALRRKQAGPFSTDRATPRAAKLEVVSVGSYDASFVPTVADFTRLDERFRFPADTWKKLPGYANYGFAVFKLKPTRGPVHPMAFTFPSAHPQQLFFPTVHIHDGEVHAKAEFDHTLYCQGGNINAKDWQESPGIAIQFMKCGLTHHMVPPNHHIYRRKMNGNLANGDLLLQASKLPA
ncbi:hypothetical protein FEM03_11810 [Phragmitibacter flavus]|uniref:Uncharacterized protein n=1 Tax=Phragmitibacter flavus TaxID=2576071 RepID=A0A5R8KDN6_9BACT|nr:hypothetical protein [Phragmitibacter flavus]TLD70411.1 hypothetical protein FEM03_11810 [Phragmitibacter flavus]